MTRLNQSLIIRLLTVIGSIMIVAGFFLPWLQMEFATGSGVHMKSIGAEYYGAGSWIVYLLYIIYILPIGALYVFWAAIFDLRIGVRAVKITLLVIGLPLFLFLLSFQLSGEMNIHVREGIILCLMGMILLFWEELTTTRYT